MSHDNVLNNISRVYIAQKRYALALSYAQRSLALAQKTGSRKEIKNTAQTLARFTQGCINSQKPMSTKRYTYL